MFPYTPLSLTLAIGDYPIQFHRKSFHKSHLFDFVNNVAILAEANRPRIGGSPMYDIRPQSSLHPRTTCGASVPAWRVYDKQILRFDGYFKDTLTESKVPYQIREIKLLYYVEDDTIQIIEPRSGSGIIKGCLVSRQRIAKPCNSEHVSLLDLNVNCCITLLDRVYHITDCDVYTRNFLQRLGIAVPTSVEVPADPTTEIRRREKEAMVPKHPFPKDFRFTQFLQNDRKVLRFSGYWDDTKSENGDIRMLEVLYHLADDTVEIKEKLPPNSGRHSNAMFLKRGKLPRHACKIRDIGEGNFAVLNVLGRDVMKGRYLRDRLDIKVGDDESKYYNETDLVIGRTLNVFGRDLLLTDCDGQTKEFYKQKYGIEEFEPICTPQNSQKYLSRATERKLPPWNGWGSYEDSEGNCSGIEPKAPKIDFKKFLCYDKLILRFGAKMISKIRENNDRLFNISYHLANDVISVFELPCRNFGFVAGEFFKKSKFYLPGQCKYTSDRPIAYRSQDFYLGATVVLRGFCFKIISADLFALKFMEDHKELYPMSHHNLIITKVREKLRPDYKNFTARYMTKVKSVPPGHTTCEFISYEDFKTLLKDLLGEAIVEHEIVTLCRHFAVETKESPREHREEVRSIVQGEILKGFWDDIERTLEFIYHFSPESVDYLSDQKVLTVIRACRVPLDIAIVNKMFQVLNRNASGKIQVTDFLSFIDVKSCKASPVPPVNPKINQFKNESDQGSLINWKRFIASVGLEEDLQTSGN